jgi:LysR family hydrogen peroxide-inducible transcriptional activator
VTHYGQHDADAEGIPTVAPYFLPTCLASFNRKFPQIRVTVVEEFTTDLLERLEGGMIDLALLALPVTGSILSQEVLRERLYVVVAASSQRFWPWSQPAPASQ